MEPARVVTSQEPVIPYRSVLVIIDVQIGFDDRSWGSRNNPQAEEVCAAVLRKWRALGWPVIHIQHDSTDPCSPLFPGPRGHDLKPQVASRPTEAVLRERVNSAFIGTDLEARLHTLAAPGLVLCGLTTDHCVSTTARMAANLGFTTWVVADACATFARTGAEARSTSQASSMTPPWRACIGSSPTSSPQETCHD